MPTPEMRDYPQDIWEAAQALRTAVVWQSNAANEIIAAALYAQRAPLLDERDALRAALEPFAAIEVAPINDGPFNMPDGHPLLGNGLGDDWRPVVTVGDVRRARAALSQSTPQTEEANV